MKKQIRTCDQRISPKTFSKLVDNYSYESFPLSQGRIAPLTNITFFVGAGFAKAWDICYPTGDELFDLSDLDSFKSAMETSIFKRTLGYRASEEITPRILKNIVYQLNMQLRYPSIRTRYMDDNSIKIVLNEIKALIQKNFENKIPINYWSDETDKFPLPQKLSKEQKDILRFFRYLSLQQEIGRAHV
jgi:methyltransferase-like protein